MADREPQRTTDAERFVEDLLRLREPALVAQDLADVVERGDVHHHVTGTTAHVAAALVEVEGLAPPTFVVRVDAEVVEHCRLADEVTELLVDRQREAAV